MTEKEKKRRQHKKELNSLRNKMGKYIVWFDSLSEKNQYDVLFAWKNEKHFNKLTEPKHVQLIANRYQRLSKLFRTNYPVNFKYFILKMKRRYRSSVSKIRESAIDLILTKK